MNSPFIDSFIAATGLPKSLVERELLKLAKKRGLAPEDLSLDQLRELLSDYMKDIILAALDAENSPEATKA